MHSFFVTSINTVIFVWLHAAGNYFGNDTGQNITFPPGSSAGDKACASTMIYSDNVLEVSEATVNVEVFPRHFGFCAS